MKRKRRLVFGLFVFLLLTIRGCIFYQEKTGVLDLKTSTSPDGKYELIIRIIPLLDIRLFTMPGDGGYDFAPIRAVLKEKATEKIIAKTHYHPDAIYCVADIHWYMEEDRVYFGFNQYIQISTGKVFY